MSYFPTANNSPHPKHHVSTAFLRMQPSSTRPSSNTTLLRPVDHFVGHFLSAMREEAVHEDWASLSALPIMRALT